MYRLAGETITTKINKNLSREKSQMQQRWQRQEEELEERERRVNEEKEGYRARV